MDTERKAKNSTISKNHAMRLIVKYLKPFALFAVLAPLFMLVEVFMDLMQPTLMARIIDSGLKSGNLQEIYTTGGLMLVLAVIGLAGGMGCTVTSTCAATGLGANLRNDVFTKIHTLSLKDLDAMKTGSLITLLTNDVIQLEDVTRMALRIMIRAPLKVVGSMIMAILISPFLSLSLTVMIPLLIFSFIFIIRRAYPLFSRVQSCLDSVNTRMQENLSAKRLVKAFVREQYEIDRFKKNNDDLSNTMIKASRITILIHPAMQIILHMGIVSVLWAGGFLININVLEIGKLVAFINYITQMLRALMMTGNLLMRISRAQVSAFRIQEIFQKKPSICKNPHPVFLKTVKKGIEFCNVHFSYNAGKKDAILKDPTLKDISFKAEPGQTFAIIGATGSGKSTLINLIPRFYDVTDGYIRIDGTDIRDFDLNSLRRQIGIVMQETILFRGTIRRNILYALDHQSGESTVPQHTLSSCGNINKVRKQHDQRMKWAAGTAMIADFIEKLPDGYDTDIHQRGVNLSGGQKQRIAIARALAVESPILIFDDATNALDSSTELDIYEALKEQKNRQIRFIITQRISSIRTADMILILENGRIAGIGTHKQLLKNNSIYQDIYSSQYGRNHPEKIDGK